MTDTTLDVLQLLDFDPPLMCEYSLCTAGHLGDWLRIQELP